MSVSFKFIKNSDPTEKVMLQDVEAEVCKMIGKPVHPTRDCIEYQCLVMLGIASTFHGGPSTKELVEEQIAGFKEPCTSEYDSIIVQMYRRFLYEEYTFDSWR